MQCADYDEVLAMANEIALGKIAHDSCLLRRWEYLERETVFESDLMPSTACKPPGGGERAGFGLWR
jgi:hypothetical protein